MSRVSDHPTLSLRPYQRDAVVNVIDRFERGGKSLLVVMPTGTGKTFVFGTLARWVNEDLGGRVLILAHREELINQACDSLAGCGVRSSIEKAQSYARGVFVDPPDCVVASVQTMRGDRLETWPKDYFKLIVTDEAHHAPATSYMSIYKHFKDAWHLGVTATADRLDGQNLGKVFEEPVAFEYRLDRAIRDGWLVRMKVARCETRVDLRDIRTTGGDFNQGELEEAIKPYIEELANSTKQEIGDRRALVFTPDVGSAEAFATALTSIGIESESVSGRSKDRDEIFDRFRRGAFRVLCNCQLISEGVDLPFVSAVVLCRPTMSRSLTAQMIGRGTRLCPPTKRDLLVVDFAWLTAKHSLIHPVELFDTTKGSGEVQEIAKGLVDSGECSDLLEAVEKAERVQHERQKMRVIVREREARYKKVVYDPMATFDVLGLDLKPEGYTTSQLKATEKQVAMLTKMGVVDAETMSRNRAGLMLDALFQRRSKDLATQKQLAWLIKKGVDPDVARQMSFKDASAMLDELFGAKKALDVRKSQAEFF